MERGKLKAKSMDFYDEDIKTIAKQAIDEGKNFKSYMRELASREADRINKEK